MELFNPEILNKWQEIDPQNWRTITIEIIDIFFESSQTDLTKLKEALSKRDSKYTYLYCHSLKSCYGNVGATHVQKLCSMMESKAELSSWEELESLLTEVTSQIETTNELINQYKSQQLIQQNR